jgi:hypothetical protein
VTIGASVVTAVHASDGTTPVSITTTPAPTTTTAPIISATNADTTTAKITTATTVPESTQNASSLAHQLVAAEQRATAAKVMYVTAQLILAQLVDGASADDRIAAEAAVTQAKAVLDAEAAELEKVQIAIAAAATDGAEDGDASPANSTGGNAAVIIPVTLVVVLLLATASVVLWRRRNRGADPEVSMVTIHG